MKSIRDEKGRFSGGLSQEKRSEVIYRYKNEKISGLSLGKEYGVSGCYITNLLRKNGIKVNRYTLLKREYPFNESYFKIIDTEDKAYFFGLLCADGCNSTKKGSVIIGLQERDCYILEEFKKFVECEIKLRFRKGAKSHHQNIYKLELYSKTMSADLEKLGCVAKKSLILKFPTEEQVPNHLLMHFVRGYFDGDGHIAELGASSIVSSYSFIKSLNEIITKLGIMSKIYDCKNPSTKRLIIGKRLNSLKFLDWIYKDATIYLKRKYDKYMSLERTLKVNQFG